MAYSVDLRRRVVQFVESGERKQKASEIFDVSLSTIQSWVRLKKETGDIKCRAYTGGARAKINKQDFEEYINKNSSKTLKEIGSHFGLSYGWAAYNLEKYGYVYKKKLKIQRV